MSNGKQPDKLYEVFEGNRNPTEKEWLVIRGVAEGRKNKDIAASIGTTEGVVKNCLRSIFDKLGFWNRTEVALWYESRKESDKLK